MLNHNIAYEPQYDDPVTEPDRFFETATRALHVEDDKWIPEMPPDWYSSDGYADKMLGYLSDRTDEDKSKPFFAYLPFSAPHWPLQAPDENVAKYHGLYSDGPFALRAARLERLKALGLVADDVKPHPVVNTSADNVDWNDLTDDVRQKSARAMEVYAGMVDRMDEAIGRVLDYLKSTGEYDNTLVLFMSDNGAEGASYEALPLMGDNIMSHIAKYYDNSLENIGRGNSFVWYGSQWAQAATAPSRLFKMHSTEGGCRVPMVVKLPKALGGVAEKDAKVRNEFCTVMDLMPTFLSLAGLQHPGSRYRGREIAPLRGCSWVPFLRRLTSSTAINDGDGTNGTDGTPVGAEGAAIHPETYAVGFEIAGSGALRRGKWKITFVPAPRGPQKWELFDIIADPGETSDLSSTHPETFKELLQLWEEYKNDVGIVGLAGEYGTVVQGKSGDEKDAGAVDELTDPYGWIKYIGRPEITPQALKGVVPG